MQSARYHYRSALKEQMQRAEMVVMRGVGRSFKRESAPSGAWAPLSPVTIALRRQGRSRGRGIRLIRKLQDTGLLRGSIGGSTNAYSHRLLRPDRLEIGTRVGYARTHQFGDPSRRIPARPFLSLWPEDRERITQMVRRAMVRLTITGGA